MFTKFCDISSHNEFSGNLSLLELSALTLLSDRKILCYYTYQTRCIMTSRIASVIVTFKSQNDRENYWRLRRKNNPEQVPCLSESRVLTYEHTYIDSKVDSFSLDTSWRREIYKKAALEIYKIAARAYAMCPQVSPINRRLWSWLWS